MAATFEARYRGECDDCEEPIIPGQEVKYRGDGTKRLVHDDCDDAQPAPARPVAVCDRCRLTRPCDCP